MPETSTEQETVSVVLDRDEWWPWFSFQTDPELMDSPLRKQLEVPSELVERAAAMQREADEVQGLLWHLWQNSSGSV